MRQYFNKRINFGKPRHKNLPNTGYCSNNSSNCSNNIKNFKTRTTKYMYLHFKNYICVAPQQAM